MIDNLVKILRAYYKREHVFQYVYTSAYNILFIIFLD